MMKYLIKNEQINVIKHILYSLSSQSLKNEIKIEAEIIEILFNYREL